MQIRLERQGKILYEVSSSQIADDIEIGRSASCEWTVPAEESVVGSRHALLRQKRGSVWVKDLDSRNGVFYRGRRIGSRKLRPGDRISVGTCVLLVERDPKKSGGKSVPEVVIASGSSRGRRRDVLPPGIAIGSDPKAGVLLLDPLISRQHAEIRVKDDGSCWLSDLKSRNGTRVNDVPLLPGLERMLKDGDTVGIAHVDLVFHDGSSTRATGQALRRLGFMAATLCVAVSAYWVFFVAMAPSAEALRDTARELAGREQFGQAIACLDRAQQARGFDAAAASIAKLRTDLDRWSLSRQNWEDAKRALEIEDWTGAAGLLGASGEDDWSWSYEGTELRQECLRTKEWLTRMLRAGHFAEQKDTPRDVLAGTYGALTNSIREARENERPYTRLLAARMETTASQVATTLEAYGKLDAELDKLKVWPVADWESVKNTIAAMSVSGPGPLRERASIVSERLSLLDTACQALNEAARLALDMDFAAAAGKLVRVPSADVCGMDDRLSVFRSNLDHAAGEFRRQVGEIAALSNDFTQRYGHATNSLAALEYWSQPAAMEGVFGCDSFNGPYRRMARVAPLAGEYDRALHIESFSDYLKRLAGRTPSQAEPPAFMTMLASSEALVGTAEVLTDWLSKPDHAWLLQGPLRKVWSDANRVLAARDAAAKAMLEEVRESSGRRRILAGALALRFSAETPLVDGKPLDEVLKAAINELDYTVKELDKENAGASALRQIEIRSRILDIGIPGLSPIVDRMWRQQTAASAEG